MRVIYASSKTNPKIGCSVNHKTRYVERIIIKSPSTCMIHGKCHSSEYCKGLIKFGKNSWPLGQGKKSYIQIIEKSESKLRGLKVIELVN